MAFNLLRARARARARARYKQFLRSKFVINFGHGHAHGHGHEMFSKHLIGTITVSIMTLYLLLSSTSLEAKTDDTPWGKDAELLEKPKVTTIDQPTAGFDSIITFHKEVISEADGPRSHFFPSSSSYMLESIRKHGLLEGYLYGCDRLMRENKDEWVYPVTRKKNGLLVKYDPIP